MEVRTVNRDYLSDPDDFSSYYAINPYIYFDPSVTFEQVSWFYEGRILFPENSTYAACTGKNDYEISSIGGMDWVSPWCAGLYALCCQVKPEITPEEFIELVKSTSVPLEVAEDGKTYPCGSIVNPAEIIKTLQEEQ